MAFVNLTDMTIAINDTPKKIIFFMLKNYSFLSYLYFILLYITPIFNNTWGFHKNIFLGGCFFGEIKMDLDGIILSKIANY